MKSTNVIVKKLNHVERSIDTAMAMLLKEQTINELKKQGSKSPAKSSKKRKASK